MIATWTTITNSRYSILIDISNPHKVYAEYIMLCRTIIANTCIHTHMQPCTLSIHIVETQGKLCIVWPLQSSLPVSSVILVPHPTSPLQYKSYSNTHPMIRLDNPLPCLTSSYVATPALKTNLT